MPHEVFAFTPAITVELSAEGLVELSAGQLRNWQMDKAANKSNQVLTLEFRTSTLSLKASKGGDVVAVQLAGPKPERECDVTLHPKTLSRAFSMLRETHARSFTLAPDPHGVVQVSWETRFGSYEMYLPLCREKRDFETRLIAPMR
jgi:DNA polymerase III sliding clamp (beta) subunit (PCNA family)